MTAEVPALTQTPTEELTLEQAERRKRLKQGLIIRKTQKVLSFIPSHFISKPYVNFSH